MKKLFYTVMACLAFVALPSCNKEDDIRKDIDALNGKLEQLAPQIENINAQIENYYPMVKGSVYIASYTKMENGDYMLKLSNGETMLVYGGQPDEEIPVVSINEKGFWCYTVDGLTAVMKDENGKPLKAVPENGQAGKTPKVSVDKNGFWVYSFDEGKTWEPMGGAPANPKYTPGNIFSKVTPSEDGNSLTFELSAGGDPVTVPLYTNMSMTFQGNNGELHVKQGASASIQATLKNVEYLVVEKTPLMVKVDEKGLVTVKAPAKLAAGAYQVHFRLVDANHYATLITLNVVVE